MIYNLFLIEYRNATRDGISSFLFTSYMKSAMTWETMAFSYLKSGWWWHHEKPFLAFQMVFSLLFYAIVDLTTIFTAPPQMQKGNTVTKCLQQSTEAVSFNLPLDYQAWRMAETFSSSHQHGSFSKRARTASFRTGCHQSSFKILPEWLKLKSN